MRPDRVGLALAVALLTGALAGCGGGDSAAPVAAPPDATRGKQLYNAIPGLPVACVTCHSNTPSNNVSNILLGRRNPGVIATAISTNQGGMSVLDGALSDQDFADLAEYLYACRTATTCASL